MFSRRPRRAPSPPPSGAALTAAATVYHPNHHPNHLAAAAAGAALRNATVSPPIGEIPTKRMLHRRASSDVGSSSSLTDRSFRSQPETMRRSKSNASAGSFMERSLRSVRRSKSNASTEEGSFRTASAMEEAVPVRSRSMLSRGSLRGDGPKRWISASENERAGSGSVVSFTSELESIDEHPRRGATTPPVAEKGPRLDPHVPSSPSRARFDPALEEPVKHTPPARSLSPAKSALKHPCSPTTTTRPHARVSFSDEERETVLEGIRSEEGKDPGRHDEENCPDKEEEGDCLVRPSVPAVLLTEPTPREELPEPEHCPMPGGLMPSPLPDSYHSPSPSPSPSASSYDSDSDTDTDSIYEDALETQSPHTPASSLSPHTPVSSPGPEEYRTPYEYPTRPPPLPASYSQPTPTPTRSRKRSLTPPPRRRRANTTPNPATPLPAAESDADDDGGEEEEEAASPTFHRVIVPATPDSSDNASISSFRRSFPRPAPSGFRTLRTTTRFSTSFLPNRRYSNSSSESSGDDDMRRRSRLGLGVGVKKMCEGLGYGSSPGESVGDKGRLVKKREGKGLWGWVKRRKRGDGMGVEVGAAPGTANGANGLGLDFASSSLSETAPGTAPGTAAGEANGGLSSGLAALSLNGPQPEAAPGTAAGSEQNGSAPPLSLVSPLPQSFGNGPVPLPLISPQLIAETEQRPSTAPTKKPNRLSKQPMMALQLRPPGTPMTEAGGKKKRGAWKRVFGKGV